MARRVRTRMRHTIAVAALAVLAAGCGGGLGGGGGADSSSGPVKIGLLVPQSGVYKALGNDMKAAFKLYVKQNDGKLGGREVEIILADEGDSAATGKAAAEKLVKQDDVLAVTGVVSSAVMNAVKGIFESQHVPLVGSNASPTNLVDPEYIWRTSYVNDQPGKALGKYVANHVDGPVYLIAADYQAGHDEVAGFKETFLPAGGKIAGEVYTPFPDTKNYQPYLANIEQSDAKAVFTFYAGSAGIQFVKQYEAFGLAGEIPLYSAGFLTEGGALDAEGKAALGVFTSMNYSWTLDNETNQKFVSAYESKTGEKPTTYAMASWDAAQVLDAAIEIAGDDLTSESLNEAIGKVEKIDSPRGTWKFNEHGTPRQMWYLREVQMVDGHLANVVVDKLGRLG